MVHICLFDFMPLELLYILFTYFFAHEILESFCDISDYVNGCLLTYSAYRLDLQSIEKCDFDNICRRILAEQVIFLRISDDSNTPGLSKHFFSHFQIEQFTQLRSFILLEIEMDSLEFILFNLHKLAQLRSLSFKSNTTKHINHGFQLDYFNEINRIYLKIFNRYPLIISRLNRLHLISSECLKSIQFPYLLHLKLEECSMNDLKTIFIRTPSLISLDICLKSEETIDNFVLTSTRFTRLHLRFDNRLISMNILEEFLSKITCLKYLVLETHGESDILNGERWENLTSNLIEFNFKFDLINCPNPNLNSFRTSFWLKEKHWFVASNFNSVFSIPHFSPSQLILPGQLFIDSTVPNHQLFYDQVTNITMVNVLNDKNEYYLNNIKILNLKCFISLEIISSIINLNKVEKLIIPSLDYILQLKSLSLIMPRLDSLSIVKLITADVIEQIQNSKFEQIHNLIIGIDIDNDNYIIECLFRLFPRIKSIKCINSINNIIRLIDGFKNLSHVSFYYNSSFSTTETNSYSHLKFNIVHKRIFTSRIYILSNNESKLNIDLWLTEQINIRENPIRIDWPIRRGFHWYRIIYICNKNIYFNIVLALAGMMLHLAHEKIVQPILTNEWLHMSFRHILLFFVYNSIAHYFSITTEMLFVIMFFSLCLNSILGRTIYEL